MKQYSPAPLTLAIALAVPLGHSQMAAAPRRQPKPKPRQSAKAVHASAELAAVSRMEQQVLERINALRTREGLQPLQADERAMRAAREYSQLMANRNFFSHTGPSGETLTRRLAAAGLSYSRAGENIAKNWNLRQPVSAAVEGWMKSPGHRANILRPEFTHTGVGVWRDGKTYYYTQVFLRPL
jgi:uncharacterized protein YkwD